MNMDTKRTSLAAVVSISFLLSYFVYRSITQRTSKAGCIYRTTTARRSPWRSNGTNKCTPKVPQQQQSLAEEYIYALEKSLQDAKQALISKAKHEAVKAVIFCRPKLSVLESEGLTRIQEALGLDVRTPKPRHGCTDRILDDMIFISLDFEYSQTLVGAHPTNTGRKETQISEVGISMLDTRPTRFSS